MSLADGTYKGRVIGYGITTTKAGDPRIAVQFEIAEAFDNITTLTWYGNLGSDKQKQLTIDALLTMGLKGNDLKTLAYGITPDREPVLNVVDEFELVLETEVYEGKSFQKIKWVNTPRTNKFKGGLNPQEAALKLGALNLEGLVMARRQAQGMPTAKPAAKPAAARPAMAPAADPFDESGLGF